MMRGLKFMGSGMLVAAVAATVLLFVGAGTQVASARADEAVKPFTLDSVHSMVMFRIGHMGVSYTYGRFNSPTGTYLIDVANPSATMIDITLDAEKVDTANERRDNHLRSPDFFNAKQYPTITFKSTGAEKTGDKTLKVTGDLTMLGVTKSVAADVEFIAEGQTPQGYKSGFEAVFKIQRSDFGMTKFLENNGLGDEVTLYVTVEGARK